MCKMQGLLIQGVGHKEGARSDMPWNAERRVKSVEGNLRILSRIYLILISPQQCWSSFVDSWFVSRLSCPIGLGLSGC